MEQAQSIKPVEAERWDPDGRKNKERLLEAIIVALIATFVALAIFIYKAFHGEMEFGTIREAFPFLVVLLAVIWWAIVEEMARGLYLGALKKFYETENLYLGACKERDSLIIKLDLMRYEKVAVENSLRIERKMRETAETELNRVRREFGSGRQEDQPAPA